MLSGLSFRSAFVSSINSLILSGFPLTSFHLAEANLIPRAILESWSKSRPQSYFRKLKNSFSPSSYSVKIRWGQSWAETSLSTFSWHYILVCAVVQKHHFFLSFFWYSFCSQPVLFSQLQNVNKLWNMNRTVHRNERNRTKKVTSHSNWTRALLSDLAHKQCNCIINPNKARLFEANNMWLTSL